MYASFYFEYIGSFVFFSPQSIDSASVPRHFPLHIMDPSLNLSLAPPLLVRTLDYLWYSSDRLQCTGVEGVVKRDRITPFWACPNQVFPSDHFLMKAAFRFTWSDELLHGLVNFALLWQKEASDIPSESVNLNYWCFHTLHSVLFFQAKFYA